MRTTSETSARSASSARFPLARLDATEEELERLVEELDRVEHVVDEPELERLGGADHPVLPERVVDDQLHGGLCAEQARSELRPAPGGEQPQEHLGKGEMTDARRERADVAMERYLEAAAERRAVHRREREERKLAQPSEELVPGLTSLPRELGRDPGEPLDVGPGGEHERLAGEHEAAPVAGAEPVEHVGERCKRLGAERVRLPPVGAVVDRHERDGADSRVEPLQVESRRGLRHLSSRAAERPLQGFARRRRTTLRRQPWRGFSHRSAAPMPSPMQRAVSPYRTSGRCSKP